MALLNMLVYPGEKLKQVSLPVKEFFTDLKKIIEGLEEIVCSFPGCAGVVASQVGQLKGIVRAEIFQKPKHVNHGFLVLINSGIIFLLGK